MGTQTRAFTAQWKITHRYWSIKQGPDRNRESKSDIYRLQDSGAFCLLVISYTKKSSLIFYSLYAVTNMQFI